VTASAEAAGRVRIGRSGAAAGGRGRVRGAVLTADASEGDRVCIWVVVAPNAAAFQHAWGVSTQNEKVNAVNDFFGILAAGPAFFVSSWVLMIFAGITGSDVGIHPFGYVTSMVVTIGLWLVLAPAAGAIARTTRKKA
jgi:hypothetical protein